MSQLYLVCDLDNVVFTFSSTSRGLWEFSRLSSFHRDNGKDKFVMRQVPDGGGMRWVLENQTRGPGAIFGKPKYPGNGPPFEGDPSPPRGMWTVWDCPFHLTDVMPRYEAIQWPFTRQVSFLEMSYKEEGSVAYLNLLILEQAIDDDALDTALQEMRRVMTNLAQRPEMVLLIRTDARRATSVPSFRHLRKFLAFIQKDVGTESVLVGRGSAMILGSTGLLGRAILSLVQMVQRMLPAPFPQLIVSTPEEADSFLRDLAAQCAPEFLEEAEEDEAKEFDETGDFEVVPANKLPDPVCNEIEINLARSTPQKGLQKRVSFAEEVSEASDGSEDALEVLSPAVAPREGTWFRWCSASCD